MSKVDLADGGWHRLHPATPFLKGGIALIAVVGVIIANLRERIFEWLFPQVAVCPPGEGWCEADPFTRLLDEYLVPVLLAALGIVLVFIALFWVSWRMHTLRVTDEVVEIRQGVIFRSHRKARLDRIQGINIQRSLLARIFGAAKLEISGAGAEANMQLAYLSGANADALRAELLRRASGLRAREAAEAVERAEAEAAAVVAAGEDGEAGEAARATLADIARQRLAEFSAPELDPNLAPPESVVTMSLGRLVGSTLLNVGTWLFALAIVGVVLAMVLGDAGPFVLFGLIPMLFGFGSFVVGRVVKSLRYSIAATADGVRVGFGLLSTSNETIPPGRIHAVEISQDILWRPFDWWTVRVNLASRSASSSSQAQLTTTILPVGSRDEVFKVLELVLPSLMNDDTRALVEAGLLPARPEDGFTTSPRRGAVLRWFSWRRNGFLLHPDAVVLRRGAVWRSLAVVPMARTQSVAVSQGPLERALRLAKVRFHTVQGPVTPSLGALDALDASALFRDTASASVAAIAADRTHRWGAA